MNCFGCYAPGLFPSEMQRINAVNTSFHRRFPKKEARLHFS